MKKKEIIIREIITQILLKNKKITQLGLAKKLNVSLSTVNNAIRPLVQLGTVEAKRRGLFVRDIKKSLIYLASIRNLKKDIIYQTYSPLSAEEIEKSLPEGTLFTAFSAYKFLYEDVPADYSEVYAYADEKSLLEIKKRFPEKKGPRNIFILKADDSLFKLSKQGIVPLAQLFIDLWNIKQWYAKEFLDALEKRMA